MGVGQKERYSRMPDQGSAIDAQAAVNDVGMQLYRLLSPGDDRVEFTISSTAAVTSPEILAFNESGEFETAEGRVNSLPGSPELWQAVRDLRTTSYKTGVGTWFSARIVVKPDSSTSATFNYDEEPDWGTLPLDPVAYVTDQEKFPRDENKQPAWLKEKLAEGRAKLAGRGK